MSAPWQTFFVELAIALVLWAILAGLLVLWFRGATRGYDEE